MSHTSFEALPLELRQRIAYYLSADFRAGYPIFIRDKRALVALAQTGSVGYEAAAPFLWKTLFFHIDWENPERLAEVVDDCTKILERNMAFQHVRSIQLMQNPYFPQTHPRYDDDHYDNDHYYDHHYDGGYGDDFDDDDDSTDGSTIDYEVTDQNLKPLVALIQKIPSLSHFYINGSSTSLPICLLEVLEASHPQSKLWFYGPRIWFRGSSISPVVYRRMCSPVLANLAMAVELESLPNVLQLSPRILGNLRHLKIILGVSMSLRDRSPDTVQRLQPYSNSDTALIALETLEIDEEFGNTPHMETKNAETGMILLRDLHKLNLSALVRLCLISIPPWMSLGTLTASRGSLFPKLQHVFIGERECPVESHQQTISFLQSLLPLRALGITGFLEHNSLQEILEFHPSLEVLRLHDSWEFEMNALTQGDLLLICNYGHQLKCLRIPYLRSQGDHVEVALYSTLGKLPRLQCLELVPHGVQQDLDGAHHSLPGPIPSNLKMPLFDQEWIDDFPEVPFTNGIIRAMLINHAMDENLARSIFQNISAGKLHGSSPLKSLTIYRGPQMGSLGSPWQDFFNVIAKSFRVTRNQRNDGSIHINVQELYHPPLSHIERLVMPETLVRLFESVWPNSVRQGHWMDNWHSFPLVTTDDTETS